MNKGSTGNITNLLLALFILATSCTGGKEKAERRDLIPEKDFIAVLTDIHIADGLMLIPSVRTPFEQGDSIQRYIDIVEHHGFSIKEMDATIRYYFVKKPKRLIKIYDEILAALTEMETSYAQSDAVQESNLWEGDSIFFFPASTDSLIFDHTFKGYGYFTLNFTLTLFPDDASVNPRFMAYFCHPDSVETGKREYYPAFNYIKDGRPHNYSFFKKPLSLSHIHLRGSFVDADNQVPAADRHLIVDNIYLNFLPAAK